MDEFYFMRSHVPPFGSWDCSNNDLPFTQCFESALHYNYNYSQDRDLYVAGDLYQNDVVTPAMIVVSRRRGKRGNPKGKKQEDESSWVICDCDCEMKPVGKQNPVRNNPTTTTTVVTKPKPKPVDEDLYKISPHLLRQHPKKKRVWGGVFSSCLRPTCVC
ncbi:hypothetical protein ABFS82_04G071700 [Erythranthe guttata]